MASRVTLLTGMLTLITKSSSGFLIKISEDVSTQSCQEVLSNLEVGLLKICYLFSTHRLCIFLSLLCLCSLLSSLCCGETESHFSRASAEQDSELETRCWRWRPAAALRCRYANIGAAAALRHTGDCKHRDRKLLYYRSGYIASEIASQRIWI